MFLIFKVLKIEFYLIFYMVFSVCERVLGILYFCSNRYFLFCKFFEENACVRKIHIFAICDFSDRFNCSSVRVFIDAICRSTSHKNNSARVASWHCGFRTASRK